MYIENIVERNEGAPIVRTDGASMASSRMTDRGAESEQGLGLEDYRTDLGNQRKNWEANVFFLF